ncbi:hypothetical protein YC2023_124742 [Brassica napus]
MEGRKDTGLSSSSSPSLTSQLFGSRNNPPSSSSSEIFESIFAPSSKVMGQETVTGGGGGWNDKSSKTGGDVDKNREEFGSSVYQQERVQPCHLSSSIYYGGPDVYFQPQNSTVNSAAVFKGFRTKVTVLGYCLSEKKKEGGEDDSGSASRGNWWQGSLYY